MSDQDRTDRFGQGIAVMQRMQGQAFADAMRGAATSERFGAFAARMAVEQTFGDIWSRSGLSLRDRSLVVLSILLAQGHIPEFRNHVRFALNNGVTPGELEEMLYQAQPYAGWGAVSQGIAATIEVLRERGLADGAQTATERGTL